MADQKTSKMELSTLPGGFEVEKNVFIDENFHFFNPKYFPIFQDGGPKIYQKKIFTFPEGISRLRKTF